MQLASRPLVTAGVILVGASLISATPAAAALPEVQAPAVELTAGGFDDYFADFTNNVLNPFLGEPFPATQQVIVNQAGYLADIWNDLKNLDFSALQTTLSTIESDIATNATNALKAPIDIFSPSGGESYLIPSLDSTEATLNTNGCLLSACLPISIPLGGHDELLNWLTNGFPIDIDLGKLGTLDLGTIDILSLAVGSTEAAQIEPYLQFLGSPLSGVLWGLVGTEFSPLAALTQDSINIYDALASSTPDYTTALNDLLGIPADMTNAFFEGFGNVDTLLSDLGLSLPGYIPELDLPGLLSPGGSFFNTVGFSVSVSDGSCDVACFSGGITDPATTASGPLASLIEMGQAIAESIGWNGAADQLGTLASLF